MAIDWPGRMRQGESPCVVLSWPFDEGVEVCRSQFRRADVPWELGAKYRLANGNDNA